MFTLIAKRFAAFFIDFLILNILVLQPLMLTIKDVLPEVSSYQQLSLYIQQHPEVSRELNTFSFLLAGLFFAYFVLLEYFTGQTLGKKLLKIKTISTGNFLVSTDGKLTFLQAFVRNMAILPLFPFFLLWIADPLWLIVKGKRISDYYTKTSVISL